MSDIVDALKKYFAETPREQIMEDWAKSEKYDNVGIPVNDFLAAQEEGMYLIKDGQISDCNIEGSDSIITVKNMTAAEIIEKYGNSL